MSASVFTIERQAGPNPYLITVREGGLATDIYECHRLGLPWLVRNLLRRGAVPA